MKEESQASLRIRSAREFQSILTKGRRIRGEYFELYISPRGHASRGRLGVSIRRRLGSAVARNRSKRLLKEAFRLRRGQLPPGIDLVVIVHRDLSRMKLAEVEGLFSEMIAGSGLCPASEAT